MSVFQASRRVVLRLINQDLPKICFTPARYKSDDLPIKWVRAEKTSFVHPRVTGDQTLDLFVDLSKPPLLFEKSKEYQNADEMVKKIFSVGFLGRRAAMQRAKYEMIESVQTHKYDTFSTEAQIAIKTANIRNLVHIHNLYPTNKRLKVYLNEIILKRKKRLKMLRSWDYRRFEWLLEKLDLVYKPTPLGEQIERKKSIRKLTQKYCDEYVERKMINYKEALHNQKADFFREKIETLEWIRKTELEYGTAPSVTEEQIEEVKKQLEEHLTTVTVVTDSDPEFRLDI